MNTFKKFILAVSLVTVLAAPLAACSRTWDGIKEDWHNVTSGDGDERTEAAPSNNSQSGDGWNVEAPKGDTGAPAVNQ